MSVLVDLPSGRVAPPVRQCARWHNDEANHADLLSGSLCWENGLSRADRSQRESPPGAGRRSVWGGTGVVPRIAADESARAISLKAGI
jgi:hypothetical protein